MTRDEAVSMIQLQLGFRTDQTTNIITALKQAQAFFENAATKPWFLLSEKTTILTTAAEERIQLPTDFLMEFEEDGLTYVPADTDESPIQLDKDDYDVLKAYWGNETGEPENYCIMGSYFRIFPTPDDEYTLHMFYYQRDAALDTNIENDWLKWAPYAMMGHAGKVIAGPLRDNAAMAVFNEWEKRGLAELYRENEARKHTNTTPQIGGEH